MLASGYGTSILEMKGREEGLPGLSKEGQRGERGGGTRSIRIIEPNPSS